MTTMIERVAFRLYVAQGYAHAFGTPEESWANHGDRVRHQFLGWARTMIEEMQEPDEAMFEAFRDCTGPEDGYRAAIEAALEEGVANNS